MPISKARRGVAIGPVLKKNTIIIVIAALSAAVLARQDGPRYLDRIGSRGEFDLLARQLYNERFNDLQHVMFVVDRREGNRVYYANSKLFRFHKDFVNALYLSLERGEIFYRNNYLTDNRRFLLGTVAYQPAIGRFTFEFWEGDSLGKKLIEEAYTALSKTFFAPVAFKPNSTSQDRSARESSGSIPVVTAIEIARNIDYQPLNLAVGIGQLRILDDITEETVIDRNQIVILRQTPIRLTPLSGIITTEPASPLSHANMLARSWGIPNAYIKNADRLFKSLEGRYVRLEVREAQYKLSPADLREVEERQRYWAKRTDAVTPPADLRFSALTDLKDQRASDARRFGAKSANLGEIMHARLPNVAVPPGFTIPFRHYQEFVSRNGLEDRLSAALEEDRFVHDPKYRRQRLAQIRAWIEDGQHAPRFRNAVISKVRRDYSGRGLFVRSSTNAEDLRDFSGAGLYTTVPNVRSEEALMNAIKKVWASIWNYEAYEARESFGMNHMGVYPGVLVQEGIEADSAGVAVTTDPFDPEQRDTVYINAKRGLGIKVVEGRRAPEQVLYRLKTNTVQVLTRSDEDTMLAFDERGGIKEVSIDQTRSVLTDPMIARLARASAMIKRVFGGVDQDIEWLYARGRLYIVQSRPYVGQS
jgi:hypothetical protein